MHSKGISCPRPSIHSWCLIQIQSFQNLKGAEEADPGISTLTAEINSQHLWIILNARGIYILSPPLLSICMGDDITLIYR